MSYTKQQLEALEIVKKLILDEHQITSYFYAGDKDTLRCAFSNILENHNHEITDVYKLSNKDYETYFEKYQDEIYEEAGRLINFGKEHLAKLDLIINYIDEHLNINS